MLLAHYQHIMGINVEINDDLYKKLQKHIDKKKRAT